ncbi:hypothetical protein WICMUC_000458 [Wickerhamomyces mucosus]|uniref:Uncharacterized protein n=1 Tax=Wickerhamomyces mucosus TaxID=1378264 RepID=A0A9P8PXQ8_9ASCO|nr:hypothetical protein WICMUC_000458 [Wickerhamomyces mucosus]
MIFSDYPVQTLGNQPRSHPIGDNTDNKMSTISFRRQTRLLLRYHVVIKASTKVSQRKAPQVFQFERNHYQLISVFERDKKLDTRWHP